MPAMGRREENKAKKRQRLEDEGLQLFLESGYDRTSIEQVAAASDVARGTFYLYFPDKRSLFETLIDHWYQPMLGLMAEVDEAIDGSQTQAELFAVYEGMATSLATLGLVHAGSLLLAFREVRRVGEAGDLLRAREVKLTDAVVSMTRRAAEKGLIVAADHRLTSLIIMGAIERLIWEFLEGRDIGEDPTVVATEVVRILTRTLEMEAP